MQVVLMRLQVFAACMTCPAASTLQARCAACRPQCAPSNVCAAPPSGSLGYALGVRHTTVLAWEHSRVHILAVGPAMTSHGDPCTFVYPVSTWAYTTNGDLPTQPSTA